MDVTMDMIDGGRARAEASRAERAAVLEAFEKLYAIICRLRAPGGCPWDREQTPATLRETILEEAYEAVEAITEGDAAHAKEELGDVMLNAVMIAYMYQQSGDFSVADTLSAVSEKLVRRHPHVFGALNGFAGPDDSAKASTADAVLSQWDEIKSKVEGRAQKSVMDGIPEALPPLMRAAKIQKKAAKVGFDFPELSGVWEKIEEEKRELREAVERSRNATDTANVPGDLGDDGGKSSDLLFEGVEDEIGDLLFSVVNVSRHLGVNPAVALSRANSKFIRRFKYVENAMAEKGLPMCRENLGEMDAFWDGAKKAGS